MTTPNLPPQWRPPAAPSLPRPDPYDEALARWYLLDDAAPSSPRPVRPDPMRERPGVSSGLFVWIVISWIVVFIAVAAFAAMLIASPRAAPDPSDPGEDGALLGATHPGASPRPGSSVAPSRRTPILARTVRSEGSPRDPTTSMSGSVETALGYVLPAITTKVSGKASWYCSTTSRCTKGYPSSGMFAAAGPPLRRGDWRGRLVRVCTLSNGPRCVVVRLVDWCACPDKVLDLYRSAFARIGNPSAGLLRVTVTRAARIGTVPQTDTR